MSIFKMRHWDRITSLLHFFLAILVTLQLFIALIMKHYHLFPWHEALGISIAIVVTLHWLWIYHQKSWTHFFPYSKKGLTAVFNDLMILPSKGTLPSSGKRAGLPGLIHGFGLLTVSMMALTGSYMFIIFVSGLPVNLFVHYIMHIHKFFAELLWIYWYGHVGMTILHHVMDRLVKHAAQ